LDLVHCYYEEYEYDDRDYGDIENQDGQRLVGASRGATKNIPFILGWNMETGADAESVTVTCTGSMILPHWFVSAAHCIINVVKTEELELCVNSTKQKNAYQTESTKRVVKCVLLPSNDIKIETVKPQGMAYLGMNDVNKQGGIKEGQKSKIAYFIRHAHSYQGGGTYGTYGGYDITVVRLETQADPVYKPACLPGPFFQDSGIGKDYEKGQITQAGFGKYTRPKCLTDEYGPSKFHYCDKKFCHQNSSPPMSPFCGEFFARNDTPVGVPHGHGELLIYLQNSSLVYCFNNESPKNGSRGWCNVEFTARAMGQLQELNTWGFCSSDCYLQEDPVSEPGSGVLRVRSDANIISDEICSKFLKHSTYEDLEHEPEVLCVGYKKTPKWDLWMETDSGFKHVQNDNFKNKVSHYLIRNTGLDAYYTSSGTCNGDSGGPVFTKDTFNRNVILGVVSGGRGMLGSCGGFNNPTHYVRLSKFVEWMKTVIGPEADELCITDS